VVFPCRNAWFTYVKDNIRPRESIIFAVSQLEIIRNEFYVYARDINCIDTQFISKKNVFDRGILYGSSSSKNTVRFKLLVTHQNFAECLKDKSENRGLSLEASDADMSKFNSDFSNDSHSSKRVQVEDVDGCVEEFREKESEMCQNFAENLKEGAKNEVVVANDSVGYFVSSLSDTSYLPNHSHVEDIGEFAGVDCAKDTNNF
ncbi:21266_t:CDS:1, partial [Racocetra persica]